MKTSEILKLTKKELEKSGPYESDHNKFICLVIKDLPVSLDVLSKDRRNSVRAIIQSRITRDIGDKGTTLESWLYYMHGIGEGTHPNFRNRVYTTRLAWVDSLIAEFKALGD
jgi:hypothetical protein